MARTLAAALFAFFTMTAPAQAAPSVPNDCRFWGFLAPDKASRGQLVATCRHVSCRVSDQREITSKSLPLQKKGKQAPSTRPGRLRLFLHRFQGRSRVTSAASRASIRF